MATDHRIVWDETGKRFYETGVDHAVLYLQENDGTYGEGVAWNGITGVTESPEGAEATPLYADNIKYLNLYSAENLKATITAYTYPDEFMACNGEADLSDGVTIGQQTRSRFGLSYRTKIGNDVNNDLGYKIHLIYGAAASPSEKAYATVNDSPEAIEFSWEISTTPINVVAAGFKPTASLTIDTTKILPDKLEVLEGLLYGTEGTASKLPTPDEVWEAIRPGKEN